MTTVNLSFDINTSDPQCQLGLEIWLDNVLIHTYQHVHSLIEFGHSIDDDDDADHQLKLVLFGKTADHTVIDDSGNIVKDACWTVSNVKMDEIDVSQLFFQHAAYTHDFNGSQESITDSFFGTAGCNGTIVFKFSSPTYLWLLENW